MPTKDPCSELSKVITDLAMMIGEQPGMDTLDKVTAELQKHIPELTRDEVVNSIVEATATHREALDEARQQVNALKREARSEAALRKRIIELERHLEAATMPEATPRPDTATDAVKELRAIRDGLNKALRQSEPARRQRILDSIDRLTERLEAVENVPPVSREAMPLSKELERLAYERDRLRRQVREKINSLKPRSFWSRTAEPINLARAMMTSLDFSAVLRQGGFVTLGHPRRAIRLLRPMIQAAKSERAAFRINQEIINRPNAPLYDRAGLHISEVYEGPLSQMEEAFMSRIAKRIPFVAGSQRGYVTFLNLLRADTFDALAETLSVTGEPTLGEAEAIANYVNVATGRGTLGKYGEQASVPLATIFFAPRLVASRFQVIAGQPFYGGNLRTRKVIAQEYGRFLAGVGVVYALGMLAGADIEDDPRSTDFGKLRWGNTRLDPLAGLAQVTTLIARVASGSTKTSGGEVVPLRGEDAPFGTGVAGTVGRFLRTKLSPVMGAALDVASGENVVGEKVTPASAVGNMMLPLAYRDIYDAMKEHGVAEGAALGILSLFGMGLSTYGPKTPAEKARIDELAGQAMR